MCLGVWLFRCCVFSFLGGFGGFMFFPREVLEGLFCLLMLMCVFLIVFL